MAVDMGQGIDARLKKVRDMKDKISQGELKLKEDKNDVRHV